MIRRLRSALRGSLDLVERDLQRSLGAHWKGFTLGLVAIGAGAPAAVIMTPKVVPWLEAPVLAGDTTYVFGPTQKPGSTTGTTYVESFPAPALPGQLYTLRIVNGGAGGANRVSQVTALLNGSLVIGPSDLTSGTDQVAKVVAITAVDTLRLTVKGPAGSFVTAAVFSRPDPTYNLFGPNQYAIPSGTSKTHTASFTRPAAAAGPYRVYVVNGAANGAQRVSNFTVAITSPGNSASIAGAGVGSAVKEVPLGAGTNNVSVQLSGPTQSFITLRVTATDTTAPVVTITAPAVGTVTRTTPITVTGTISDASPTSVTVNGVGATVSNNTSYAASVPLSTQGSNLLTVMATDAGGKTSQVTRTVTFDSQAPALTLSAPADNSAIRNAVATVTGTALDVTAVSVNTNGTPWTVGGGGAFTGAFPLAVGANVLTTTATDAAGNATSVVRNVTRDTLAPVLTVSAPSEGATTSADSITVSGSVTDQTMVTVAANGVNLPVSSGNFSRKIALVEGPNTITIVATDAATNATTVTRNVTRETSGPLPPDPVTVATPLDPTEAPTMAGSTAFLYSGTNPIQTGVAPGTIEPVRAAVIRGRVLDRSGAALPAATITVLNHPELGQTRSRADGRFDLAVNGGGVLTLSYAKSGFFASQRQIHAPTQDYTVIDDVVLVPLDSQVTSIDFSQPIEVARGSVMTDADGTRRATLLFRQGTQASMVLPNGTEQPLTTLSVRATEYTVGATGKRAMPAPLPPATAYTYAAELSADEAVSAGATEVRFTKPVAFYLENFLHFPVGVKVPFASYDRTRAVWVPGKPGRVIKILGVVSGLAQLAVDTSKQAATAEQLTSLGITDDERGQLATLYPTGQTLWRTEHTHFTPGDWNPPFGPDPRLNPPGGTPKGGGDDDETQNDPCKKTARSTIECETQLLREELSISGTGLTLNYQSGRASGFRAKREFSISLIRDTVPAGLKRIEVAFLIAGQEVKQTFQAQPNQSFNFTWDGKDAYGRRVPGSARAEAP